MCKCLHAPKICGKWVICKSCSLDDEDLSKVNCLNNCSCNNSTNPETFQVTQNNMFVKLERESDNKVFMGVWRPIYKDSRIKDWELKAMYGESDGEFLMQISKFDAKTCKPSEMFFTYVEKAAEDGMPTISYGALKKMSCTCC